MNINTYNRFLSFLDTEIAQVTGVRSFHIIRIMVADGLVNQGINSHDIHLFLPE